MGDDGVTSPVDNEKGEIEESPLLSYSDFIYQQFPMYINMGMTADEYWNGDYELLPCYRKAAKEKLKNDNYMAWLQGLYVYEAMICVAPTFNSLKPTKPHDYRERPIPITREEQIEEENRKTKLAWEQMLSTMKQKAEYLAEHPSNNGGD